ncbi:MAG: hypothetical protein IPG57_25050 [Burkholderiales bacterium]|nr:hypothetical protein [Burkholderiales bacterium]
MWAPPYRDEVNWLKNWLNTRVAWIDQRQMSGRLRPNPPIGCLPPTQGLPGPAPWVTAAAAGAVVASLHDPL